MHIAIAGNIGSGKTTLTKMLAKRYGWTPRFEPVDNNPYLDDFYHDMNRWSFNLQVYFLNKRFKEVVEISQSDENIIQDRTIFEDAKIFAPNLHDQGYMSDRDIEKRGRSFEKSIRIDYLTGLQQRYEDWIKNYKGELIIIDGDKLSFEDTPEDFRKVTDMIDASLYGLFPLEEGK